ncbi:tricorn protease domain 2-containing protein, partial [Punctularia strigosozonata HHB-11173 SS5]|uniref:tricorn protease domain 2-containing protein n=1 Tax=Punctularia strigosozonata (strain HHB-11173) TaxID=741275 RepID=UPI0004417175
IRRVAFLRDGRRVVSSSRDECLQVWDAETGELAMPVLCNYDLGIALSSNRKYIASIWSERGTVLIWNAETGEVVGQPFNHRDGLISCSWDFIKIWDIETGQLVKMLPITPELGKIQSFAFSSDGRQIVSVSVVRTLHVWTMETGEPSGIPLRGHTRLITSLDISYDGKRIVSGSDDKTIRIWDMEPKDTTPPHSQGYGEGWINEGIFFLPDGKHIVSFTENLAARLWDLQTGETIGEPLPSQDEKFDSVDLSPDGNRFVAVSRERFTIQMWDARTGESIGEPMLHVSLDSKERSIYRLAWSPEGPQIISSHDGTLRIWDVETGQLARDPWEQRIPISALAISADGGHVASGLRELPFSESIGPETIELKPDGWVVGPKDERLLWIPPQHRRDLIQWPCTMVIPSYDMVQLDLSRFAHGTSWQDCYT